MLEEKKAFKTNSPGHSSLRENLTPMTPLRYLLDTENVKTFQIADTKSFRTPNPETFCVSYLERLCAFCLS